MNTYGERVKVTIFGESHGPAIGVVLDGVPAGEAIDMDAVRIQMRRRAPGSSDLTTHRSETDDPLVMSGILNGVTTGAPISAIFRNKDQNSAAYHPEIPRPSHADYAATVRFGGHADLRGGGPFSGRLTACLVFAGAVCRQILERRAGRRGRRSARSPRSPRGSGAGSPGGRPRCSGPCCGRWPRSVRRSSRR